VLPLLVHLWHLVWHLVRPWHLGDLHAYETALVLVVSFAPFAVIALLAWRQHRRPAGSGDDAAVLSPDEAGGSGRPEGR
jgi:hypothetical protein